jgi:peptide/nickel transport system permease protein
MLLFLLRRLLGTVLLVLAVGSAVFILIDLAPGDAVTVGDLGRSPEEIRQEREYLGLDRPLPVRYASWLSHIVRLDAGESVHFRQPAGPIVRSRALNTAVLAVASFAIALVVGIGISIAAARRPGGVAAFVSRNLSLVGLSIPPFVTSLLLLWVAAKTGWLPAGGMPVLDVDRGLLRWLVDVAWHLTLPALALALPVAAMLERVQTQALAEALASPAVQAARARGVPETLIVGRHAWRLSLKPVAAVAGLVFGGLLSGSFAVEFVTAWPGLGLLTVDALLAQDLNLVAACAIAGAVVLSIGVLLADLVAAWSDPRIRLQWSEGRG